MTKRFSYHALAAGILLFFQAPAIAQAPSSYPADYSAIIEASRKENALTIYSNMANNNWKPLMDGFQKLYPWIKVETLDLGSGTVHTRWEAESGSGARTADLLVSGANDRWAAYGVAGRMLDYKSPELDKLPAFAKPYPGVFVASTDPLVLTFNTALVKEGQRPTGLSALAKAVAADPAAYKGKITTYDSARNAFGLAAWWYTLKAKGEAGWADLRVLGPAIKGEVSGGPMNEKVVAGEYLIGIAVSGITIFPRLDRPGGQILGYAFPDDGTPVMLRGMGIPKQATNINAAKLMLDFMLSPAGQTLLGKGGLVPYRDEVAEADVRFTYRGIAKRVGAEKMIIVGFDKALIDEAKPFVEKWNAAMQGR